MSRESKIKVYYDEMVSGKDGLTVSSMLIGQMISNSFMTPDQLAADFMSKVRIEIEFCDGKKYFIGKKTIAIED